MKKIFFVIAAAAMMLVGCTKELEQKIEKLDVRVSALEEAVKALNTEVSGIKTILNALEANVYVSAVNTVTDGYQIVFTNGTTATIKNGAKGDKGDTGAAGQNGTNGTNGKDGKDGVTPVIGVKEVDGVLYWTVNGVVLTDAQGNPVQAEGENGEDGEDGVDGEDGEDGIDGATPEFKVEEGVLYYSVDNKTTWIELGNVAGENGKDANAWFTLEQTANTVVLKLTEGGEIVLPKYNNFDITIVPVGLKLGETKAITYAVTGSTSYVVRAYAAEGWTVKVNAAKNEINVVAPTDATLFLNGYVDVYAICNATGKVCAKSLTFPNAGSEIEVPELEVTEELPVAAYGDNAYEVSVTTDYAYEVVIPADATWLTYVETKAARTETLVFKAAPNTTGKTRTAVVNLTVNGISVAEIPFTQKPVATAVVITPNETELLIGSTVKLAAAVTPADAVQTVAWTSESYLVVDKDGNVKFNPEALAYGYANAAVGNTVKVFATTTALDANAKPLVDTAFVKISAVQVKEVTTSTELVKAKVGQKFTVDYTVLPENASDKKVVFKSSDENVLKVDENGVVTVVASGEAKITITSKDAFAPKAVVGEEYTYVAPSVEVVVAVSNESVLTELTFAEPTAQLHLAGKLPVVFTQDVKAGEVEYAVLDAQGQKSSYVVVNETEKGDTVMVSTLEGVENYLNVIAGQTFSVVATVVENPMVNDTLKVSVYANLVTSLEVDATLSLEVGKADTLEAVVNKNADCKDLKWTSMDPAIATVDANGKVTGVSAGTVKVAVEAMDKFNKVGPNVSDTCVVYVNAGDVYPVTKVEFNKTVKDTVDFAYDTKVDLTKYVTVSPAAPLTALNWTVLDANGVAANSKVTVDAAKSTVAINTAEGYEAYLNTTVNVPYMVVATSKYDAKAVDTLVVRPTAKLVNALSLGATELEFTIGAKYQLQYTITSDAADKTVKWTVKGDAVTVDQNGNIEAVKAGEATVVLESMDKFNLVGPNLKAECKVVVNKKAPTKISFAAERDTVKLGASLQLTPVLEPADAETYDLEYVYELKSASYAALTNVNLTKDGLFTANLYQNYTDNVYKVKVYYKNYPSIYDEITIVVDQNLATAVAVNFTSVNVTVGEPFNPTLVVTPLDASNKNLYKFSGSNVKDNKDGTFTVTKAGTTTVKVQMDGAYMMEPPYTTFQVVATDPAE